MNDMSPADDELLSSYLDGEATSEEVARIETDPTLLARVEELRAARDLVATPVTPLPSDEVDTMLAAALDASTTAPVVTGIERARRRRSDRVRTMVAVAAGVLLIAIAVPVLGSLGSDSGDDDTATADMSEMDAPGDDDAGDDTAGDDEAADDTFSLESAPAAADSDDDRGDDTAAEDNMADDDPADDDDSDDPAPDDGGATSTTTVVTAGLQTLDPVLDDAELLRAVEGRLDAYANEVQSDAAAFEERDAAACTDDFDFLTASSEIVLVDSTVTSVGGAATAVVLGYQPADGKYVLYTTPVATCSPIAVLDLEG